MTTPIYCIHGNDFRTYKPELCSAPGGEKRIVTVCEELVEGRWESFVSMSKPKVGAS